LARRRSKSDAISTAGQIERPRDPSGDTSLDQPIGPRQEFGKTEPAAEPSQHYDVTGLKAQLDQQRQHAEQMQLRAYINAIPGLSGPQRQFLAANPHGLYRFDLLHAGHTEALERGVPVDSGEYFRYLADKLNTYFHTPPQQPMQSAPAPHVPAPPPPMPAQTHVDLASHDTEPESAQMATHYSAPVSRGDHGTTAVDPELSPSQIRLTPEERELCALNKISETVYAAGKLRLAKQKAAKIRD
jgi:hypothetical protein